MRTAPQRNPWLVFAASASCLVGGPILGSLVATFGAPASAIAQWLSPLAFVLAFVLGELIWFGLGVVSVVAGGVARRLRGRLRSDAPDPNAELIPPGYRAFLPVSILLGGLAGLVAAVTQDAGSGWPIAAAHVAAGFAYGASLRAAAHHGYVPFPEPG